jgi:hypothetical protein
MPVARRCDCGIVGVATHVHTLVLSASFQPARPMVSPPARRRGGKQIERQALVERSAREVGERWALGWRAELESEHRSAAGGWPGTIAQARACARAHLSAVLAGLQLAEPSTAELEQAARLTYARARAVWLAFAQAEDR